METKCKHGMRIAFCGLCQPQPQLRPAHRRADQEVGQEKNSASWDAERSAANASPFTIVYTRRGHPSWKLLGPQTRLVHLSGIPLLWAIEEILVRCPALQVLQMIPTFSRSRHFGERHQALCTERRVEVRFGHVRPNSAWEKGRIIDPFWRRHRAFLLNLTKEQKQKWEELCVLGFESAQMTARYFCLKDEKYAPLYEIAKEFDISVQSYISARINAVLRYLEPTHQCAKAAQEHAATLAKRVAHLQPFVREEAARREYLEHLLRQTNLVSIPLHLPFYRIHTYIALAQMRRDTPKRFSSRACQVLILRFGLNDMHYKTLQAVGDMLGLTRERIRQLEDQAFEELGIAPDELEGEEPTTKQNSGADPPQR